MFWNLIKNTIGIISKSGIMTSFLKAVLKILQNYYDKRFILAKICQY